MNIQCYVPAIPEGVANKSDYVRTKLQEALNSHVDINENAIIPDLERCTIYFSKETAQQVMSLSKKYAGIAPGRIVGLLIHGIKIASKSQPDFLKELEPLFRPEQVMLLRVILPAILQNKLVLSEASTGVGKSRILCLSAIKHFYEHQKDAVIIATPTIQTLTHMYDEFEHTRQMVSATLGEMRPIKVAALLGRGQFVNFDMVNEFLNDFPDEGVRQWMAEGAPAGLTRSTSQIKRIHPDIRGLMDDLMHVASDFPSGDCAYHADDAGYSWYDTLREEAMNADVVLSTHIMLATDTLLMKRNEEDQYVSSIFPPYGLLLIDEAHQLEDAFAQACSSGLALSRLRSSLSNENWKTMRADTLAKSIIKKCDDSMNALKLFPEKVFFKWKEERPGVWDSTIAPALCQLQESITPLLEIMNKRNATDRTSYHVLRNAKVILGKVIDQSESTSITFAPTKRWPTIAVGPSRVDWLLKKRWDASPAVVMMSATLYVLDKNGAADPKSAVIKLGLHGESRQKVLAPVYAPWLFTTPTLWRPTGELRSFLTPPRVNDLPEAQMEIQMHAWMIYVAATIKEIVKTAKGGTLVLMSGYDRMECLTGLLDGLEERLVIQSKKNNFASCRTKYMRLYHEGVCPIWIATGPAGTGLDLSDSEMLAKDDFLLTDLIIPNVPIGTNHSTTHKSRTGYFGFLEELSTTSILLKQWIGRLVRREGVTDRRMWILDGRIGTVKGFNNFESLLQRYTNKEEFESLDDINLRR